MFVVNPFSSSQWKFSSVFWQSKTQSMLFKGTRNTNKWMTTFFFVAGDAEGAIKLVQSNSTQEEIGCWTTDGRGSYLREELHIKHKICGKSSAMCTDDTCDMFLSNDISWQISPTELTHFHPSNVFHMWTCMCTLYI